MDCGYAVGVKIAILDDYQDVALSMADWSGVERQAEVTVFADHLADQDLSLIHI